MTVNPLPEDILKAPTIEAAAERLGELLGSESPPPVPAVRRALTDPLFARALLATRKMPEALAMLLAAPDEGRITPPPPSSAKIVGQAAGALLKWGMEGLKHAEPWAIERRLAACAACEFQAKAPDTLVYRGAKVAVGKDAKICLACNCLTNTKAALATERCPRQDPANPELSRWGEPWIPLEKHDKGPW